MASKPIITETGLFRLKPNVGTLNEADSKAMKAAEAAVKIALGPGGGLKALYGSEVENPQNFRLWIDWKDHETLDKFTKSEDFTSFKSHIDSITESASPENFNKVVTYSVPKPITATPLREPATEVLTLHFAADLDAAGRSEAEKRVDDFVAAGLAGNSDFKGFKRGWTEGDDLVPYGVPEGEKRVPGAALVCLLGWTSVEAHMKGREAEEFKSNAHIIRTIPGCVKMAVYHVSCKHATPSTF